nr:uncharacterized protein LOC109173056 [Ipomoea batatas]
MAPLFSRKEVRMAATTFSSASSSVDFPPSGKAALASSSLLSGVQRRHPSSPLSCLQQRHPSSPLFPRRSRDELATTVFFVSFLSQEAWIRGRLKVVEMTWQQSVGSSFQQRLSFRGKNLWTWGGDYFRRFGRRLKQLRQLLDALEESR